MPSQQQVSAESFRIHKNTSAQRGRLIFTILFFGTIALVLGVFAYMWFAEDRVIGHIRDRDPYLAAFGAYVLAKKGVPERAELPLQNALSEGDVPLRAAAARALGRTRKERYVAVLSGPALQDASPTVRRAALEGLQHLDHGSAMRTCALSLRQEEDVDVLVAACGLAGALRLETVIPDLIIKLEHPDTKVVEAARKALLRYNPDGASMGSSMDAWNQWYGRNH